MLHTVNTSDTTKNKISFYRKLKWFSLRLGIFYPEITPPSKMGENLRSCMIQTDRRHHTEVVIVVRPLQDRPSTEPSHTWVNVCNLHRNEAQFFLLKIPSSLESHKAQHNVAAPTRYVEKSIYQYPATNYRLYYVHNVGVNIWSYFNYDPHGTRKLTRKRCLIHSSCWQKTHVLLPCQLQHERLFLVKITPLFWNQMNMFTQRGISSF